MEKIVNENVTEFLFEQEKEQSFLFEQTEEPTIRFDGEKPTELYRDPPVKGALLDGEQVPIDGNKNLVFDIGLSTINDKLDNYLGNSTVKVFFRNIRFEKNGDRYEIRIPMSEHKRGSGAIVEKVFEYADGDFKETFSQSYTMSDGSVIVATHRTFDGMIYIKGANEYGE